MYFAVPRVFPVPQPVLSAYVVSACSFLLAILYFCLLSLKHEWPFKDESVMQRRALPHLVPGCSITIGSASHLPETRASLPKKSFFFAHVLFDGVMSTLCLA